MVPFACGGVSEHRKESVHTGSAWSPLHLLELFKDLLTAFAITKIKHLYCSSLLLWCGGPSGTSMPH